MVIAIVAVDDNLGISRKGAIPWSVPSDLWFFKAETMGNMVVMVALLMMLLVGLWRAGII